MNSYELSRAFFDWSFENPEKVTPTHVAMYFFIIEHCNRLGWKEKFGLPTTMVKDAIGIKNYRTYINALNDLVEFGFITMVEKSKNQYSSNIIAIAKFTKAHTKALDKALQKHSQKHCKSIDSIDKQITMNKERENIDQPPRHEISPEYQNQFQMLTIDDCRKKYDIENVAKREQIAMNIKVNPQQIILLQNSFDKMLKTKTEQKGFKDYTDHFANWASKLSAEAIKEKIIQAIPQVATRKLTLEERYSK